MSKSSQHASTSIVQWGLASFVISLCADTVVTILIVARIWYLSPRKRSDALGANFPTDTGWAAIVITIESGVLYLVVQLIYCVLFVLRHPAQNIFLGIAVQIYVRIHSLNIKLVVDSILLLYHNHTGHRTHTNFHSHVQLTELDFQSES